MELMSENQTNNNMRTVLTLSNKLTHKRNSKPSIKLDMQFTDQLTPVHYKKKRLSVNQPFQSPASETETNTEPYVWYVPDLPRPEKKSLLIPTSEDDIKIISLLESRNIKERFAEGLSFRYFGICITGTNAVKATVPTGESTKRMTKLFSFSKFENPLSEALTWQMKVGQGHWKELWAAVCHGHLQAVRKENFGINVRPVTQGKSKEFVHCVVEWRELEDKNKKGSVWFSVSQSGSAQKAEELAYNKQDALIKARKTYLENLGSTVSILVQ